MNTPAVPPAIFPLAIYPYFDKVQVWLKSPADPKTVDRLQLRCGHFYVDNRSARFGDGYRQRLEFKQPKPDALAWIACQRATMINRVEIALDLVFADRNRRDDAFEFFHRHLIRRWHGKRQRIKLVRGGRKEGHGGKRAPELVDEVAAGQTRYDGGRCAPNQITLYRAQYSRVTGELNCLHLEWRLNTLASVQNAGITSGVHLFEFDHRQFWARRMRLVSADPEKLGRCIRNRVNGTKSRTPEPGNNRFVNLDQRRGSVMLQAFGTMQEFVDAFGSSLRLHRILSAIPNEAFLPLTPSL